MTEYVERKGREKIDGVEVLRWSIRLPRWEAWESFSQFYEEIAAAAEAFCQGELRERALGEYESSDDPKKKFYFPTLHYSLNGRVTYEGDPLLSVRLDAELRRGRESLAYTTVGQILQTEGQIFLSPLEAVRLLYGLRVSLGDFGKAEGALIDCGKLFLCRDNRWEEWEPIKKKK